MCGRYALYSSPDEIASHFSATLLNPYQPAYNIAPTATISVLVMVEGERLIVPMRWGLIPVWHKEGQQLSVLNNAKLETIETKPSFKLPFKRHRCLIVADGFYEWDASAKPKQPYYFHQDNNMPLLMAGIWEKWMHGEHAVDSCAIITTTANDVVGKVHDRMPVCVGREEMDKWLDAAWQDPFAIKQFAENSAAGRRLLSHPVTTKVNRVAFDNAACVEPVDLT